MNKFSKFKGILIVIIFLFIMVSCGEKTTPTTTPTTPTVPSQTTKPVSCETTTKTKVLTGIELKNTGEIYVNKGDNYDGSNLLIYAIYSDGTEENISTQVTFTSLDTTSPGTKTIKANYQGFEIEISINVVKLTGIDLDTTNAKVTYEQGESIDISGLIVFSLYDEENLRLYTNNYRIVLTNSIGTQILVGSPLNELGTYTVTVSVGLFEKTYEITVSGNNNPVYERLELDTNQVKKDFVNEEFNYDGLILYGYTDNTTKSVIDPSLYEVNLTKDGATVDGFEDSGTYVVKITYSNTDALGDLQFEYEVTYNNISFNVTFNYSGYSGEEFNVTVTTNDPKDYIVAPEGYTFIGFSEGFQKWEEGSYIKIYVQENKPNKAYIAFLYEGYEYDNFKEYDINTTINRDEIDITPREIPDFQAFLYWDLPYSFVITKTMYAFPVFGPENINYEDINVTTETTINNVCANAIDVNFDDFISQAPDGFELDAITLGLNGEVISEISYQPALVSAYFTDLEAETEYEIGAYYKAISSPINAKRGRELTYRFHFVGFMIITRGDVMYRVRMMYNGDCLYRWYFAQGTYVYNHDFFYSFTLPIEYDGYTCAGGLDDLGYITSDVDYEVILIPPAKEVATVVFYDETYPVYLNILSMQSVNIGQSAIAPEIDDHYFNEQMTYRYNFVRWSVDFSNVNSNMFIYPIYEKEPIVPPTVLLSSYIGDDYAVFNVRSNYYDSIISSTISVKDDNALTVYSHTDKYFYNYYFNVLDVLKPDKRYTVFVDYSYELNDNKGVQNCSISHSFTTQSTDSSLGYNLSFTNVTYYDFTIESDNEVDGFFTYRMEDGNMCDLREGMYYYFVQNTTYYVNYYIEDDTTDGLYYIYSDDFEITTPDAELYTISEIRSYNYEDYILLQFKIDDKDNTLSDFYLHIMSFETSYEFIHYVYIDYLTYNNETGYYEFYLPLSEEDPDTGEIVHYEAFIHSIEVNAIYDGSHQCIDYYHADTYDDNGYVYYTKE